MRVSAPPCRQVHSFISAASYVLLHIPSYTQRQRWCDEKWRARYSTACCSCDIAHLNPKGERDRCTACTGASCRKNAKAREGSARRGVSPSGRVTLCCRMLLLLLRTAA